MKRPNSSHSLGKNKKSSVTAPTSPASPKTAVRHSGAGYGNGAASNAYMTATVQYGTRSVQSRGSNGAEKYKESAVKMDGNEALQGFMAEGGRGGGSAQSGKLAKFI
jgi:hypothetical protein